MHIDTEKLIATLRSLADDVNDGPSCETSVFIGEIDGCPVQLAVMRKDHARKDHDYKSERNRKNRWACISDAKPSQAQQEAVK